MATASAVSWILTAEQAGDALRQVFLPFQASPQITMLLIAAVTLVLGTAMEETTMLVLMTPMLEQYSHSPAMLTWSAALHDGHFLSTFLGRPPPGRAPPWATSRAGVPGPGDDGLQAT